MFMDRYGLCAPPCGYWIKSSMTRVYCRVLFVRIRIIKICGIGGLTWMFMDRYRLCAQPCGYCLKASMTAAWASPLDCGSSPQ